MLGRKDYTRVELDHAKEAISQQLAAYKTLAGALSATSDKRVKSAFEALESVLFNDLVLVLDRYIVHRLRMVASKAGTPLNEVELLTESLMNKGGVLRAGNVIRYIPEQSVLKLHVGDRIKITGADFERLARAFFAELEKKFLSGHTTHAR